jgi:hypothetical protein
MANKTSARISEQYISSDTPGSFFCCLRSLGLCAEIYAPQNKTAGTLTSCMQMDELCPASGHKGVRKVNCYRDDCVWSLVIKTLLYFCHGAEVGEQSVEEDLKKHADMKTERENA